MERTQPPVQRLSKNRHPVSKPTAARSAPRKQRPPSHPHHARIHPSALCRPAEIKRHRTRRPHQQPRSFALFSEHTWNHTHTILNAIPADTSGTAATQQHAKHYPDRHRKWLWQCQLLHPTISTTDRLHPQSLSKTKKTIITKNVSIETICYNRFTD